MFGLPPIVIMGVEGSGKSTVAQALSERLDCEFVDADWLHPLVNKEKMASGESLTDEDRLPWLRIVGDRIKEELKAGRTTITSCSALKRAYRDLLRQYAENLFFVFLDGPIDVVRTRIQNRRHDFMPNDLLESQYQILEPLAPDESGVVIDIQQRLTEQLDEIVAALPS